MTEADEDFNVTIRINESGLFVCDAATVRQDFGSGIYYNEPRESILLVLTDEERDMVYRFRSRYPAQPHITEEIR